MPDTNPTPVARRDLDNIQDGILYGDDEERAAIATSVIADLRSARAAISGPDSERIREVIATAIAAGKNPARKPQPLDYENADEILAALRDYMRSYR